MVKSVLNSSLITKMLKILNHYAYFFPKISAHRKYFDETKYVSFLIKDDDLLEKYNEIWEKVKISIKKEFDSEPIYNEKYLQTKIKSCNGKVNTNFQSSKISKEVLNLFVYQ